MSRRRRTLFAAALAVGVLAGACTEDSPQTDLPCEFYFGQRDSGVDVEIPAECGDDPASSAPSDSTPY